MYRESASGIVLLVQAQPGARREGVLGVHAGRLKVAVHQAPEKGKANKEIIRVLAGWLGLKKNQLQLISGETVATKEFLIVDWSKDDLDRHLATATFI